MIVGELPTTGPAPQWIRAPQHGGPDFSQGPLGLVSTRKYR
jgi:hypothetical protein